MWCRQGDKVTREQNARIAALKEDNYEEYLKLAANTKNQRLRTLLQKTGSISELGLKVSIPSTLNTSYILVKSCMDHYLVSATMWSFNSTHQAQQDFVPC